MDAVSQTLYPPLYGKAYVSKKGIILHDPTAEAIWDRAGVSLRGKARSKWLAYYMAMRAAVFDAWLVKQMEAQPEAVVVHIGCGLDSRFQRTGRPERCWYDVDFPEVLAQRRLFEQETGTHHLVETDGGDRWVKTLPSANGALVVMEGVSMYMPEAQLRAMLDALSGHFGSIHLLMDAYTPLAARMSRWRNPVCTMGVQQVYGLESPQRLEGPHRYVREHEMTPWHLVNQLQGLERCIFRHLYGGRISRRLYRLYEYQSA